MKLIIHVPRTDIIVGGLEIVVNRPSPYRYGYDNWIRLITPQRRTEAAILKGVGKFWFKASESPR